MSRWGCPTCGTVFGLRLYGGCPRCPGTELVEEANMPKITVHGGPSNADDPRPAEPATEPDDAGLRAAIADIDDAIREANDEGGEQPSPGTSSSTSNAKPRKSTATRKSASPSPAPTTENP
jgi:predicted  nucleic acid-binding Zn-ribbon protein